MTDDRSWWSKPAWLTEAREYNVHCPACGALMLPANTTLSWWDCQNIYCMSGI